MVVIPPGHERIRIVRTYRYAELESSRNLIGLSGGTANRVFRQLIIVRSIVENWSIDYAAKRKASSPLKLSWRVHTAHMIRAILFANATVALLWPILT